MMYDFSKIKKRIEEIEQWFRDEISLLRTGRATPALVENIKIDYYGTKTPLKGVAAISVEDARTLRVKPWDTEIIMNIEAAVRSSDLGVQAITEKDTVRIPFPELTEERRKSLLKILSEKLEEARISMRRERDEIWKDIQDGEREGVLSEDEKYRHKDDLQDIIDKAVKKFEEIASRKQREISH
ncbi:MAG: ribosome recycling factor [Candidatus Tagabacteria bacterium CG09_land_8_20_14_0_10_41_14]|uniref:Ribosome recycling factor n=2 Tax=Candidatus Tagaibacteriota TaxID=1817918 RepID=A0A2H0WKY1_9BACT|nr:MAG: ribosome recycling factor [Candidatus Tagabacteria bacterium CG09_land_8_20_14_0_10_41_14]PJE73376.1 MAG: ribosome recycling factor [Candidatus Tagabacteria bacterium CG10_big_fil_rev_8_21_14_0_10_40_13]